LRNGALPPLILGRDGRPIEPVESLEVGTIPPEDLDRFFDTLAAMDRLREAAKPAYEPGS
jgi:hypothetical protein